MKTISTVIAAKGNPPYILQTIESIHDISTEIIIIDIGLDKELHTTLQKNTKITIISWEFPVPYIELIREEMFKYATSSHILYLDPDEVVPNTLKKILVETIKISDIIALPRKNIIFGKWIEHARWWPDYQIRLFKKNSLIWPKELHAQPIIKSTRASLEAIEQNALIHYNYTDIDEYFAKLIRYAKADAHTIISQNQTISLRASIQKGISEFISRFFAEKGYLDGMHGFSLSFLQMIYYIIVFMYVWEIKGYKNQEKNLIHESIKFFKQGYKESMHWNLVLEKESQSISLKKRIHYLLVKYLL